MPFKLDFPRMVVHGHIRAVVILITFAIIRYQRSVSTYPFFIYYNPILVQTTSPQNDSNRL